MIKYQITDPKYFTTDPHRFLLQLSRSVRKHKPEFICYRDKTKINREKISKLLKLSSKNYRTKFIINQDLNLAVKYKFYGIHLTSKQFKLIKEAKRKGLFVVVSTHTEKEIQQVLKLGGDLVTYSPIFKTPNKGEPKGVEDFKKIALKYKKRVIALGGITTDKEVEKVFKAYGYGIASIRFFV
ncbi:MAG: thiamine phosphate synthase [Campylobacterales bacterium]|nr:thiamine phosphate synthase [Campylobacterales bacterium]